MTDSTPTAAIPLERTFQWRDIAKMFRAEVSTGGRWDGSVAEAAAAQVDGRLDDSLYRGELVMCTMLNMVDEVCGTWSVKFTDEFLASVSSGPEHVVRSNQVQFVVHFDNEEDSALFKLRWM